MSDIDVYPKKLRKLWEQRRKEDGHAWCTPDEANWLEGNNLRQPGHSEYRFSTATEDLSDETQERRREEYLQEVINNPSAFTPRQLRDIRRHGYPLDEYLSTEDFLDETPGQFRERIGSLYGRVTDEAIRSGRIDANTIQDDGAEAVYAQAMRDITEYLVEYALWHPLAHDEIRNLMDAYADEHEVVMPARPESEVAS